MTSEIPSQLPVLQELEGTDGLVLWIFVISLLPMFSRSRNLFLVVSQSYHSQVISKIQVNFRFRSTLGYCRLGLMDFSNFFILYYFDVRESVYRSFTRPLFSDDFEIPGQLPVLQELEGTDGLVLWIFVISLLPMFSRSRNLFLVVSQNYHVQTT